MISLRHSVPPSSHQARPQMPIRPAGPRSHRRALAGRPLQRAQVNEVCVCPCASMPLSGIANLLLARYSRKSKLVGQTSLWHMHAQRRRQPQPQLHPRIPMPAACAVLPSTRSSQGEAGSSVDVDKALGCIDACTCLF
eukprot:1161266-Pelagomonas_calceolata.AAC.10